MLFCNQVWFSSICISLPQNMKWSVSENCLQTCCCCTASNPRGRCSALGAWASLNLIDEVENTLSTEFSWIHSYCMGCVFLVMHHHDKSCCPCSQFPVLLWQLWCTRKVVMRLLAAVVAALLQYTHILHHRNKRFDVVFSSQRNMSV